MNQIDFFVTVIMLILLIIVCVKQKTMVFYKSKSVIPGLIVLAAALVSCFAGVSLTDSFYGFLRVVSAIIWVVLLMQFSTELRQRLLHAYPLIAILVMLGSVGFSFIPAFHSYVLENGFLAGPFGYANTMGLFMLGALVVELYCGDLTKWRHRGMAGLLLAGVLWSGSRITIGIMVVFLLVITIKKSETRKITLSGILISIVAILGYLAVAIARSEEGTVASALNTSGFVGRILYWKDAMSLVGKHPLGMGYLGYFFLVEGNKTGVYTVRFVHNDWLQIALDFGWVALAAFVVLFVLHFRRAETWKKVLMTIIGIHMFTDMDLQYMAILWILLLVMDFNVGTRVEKKRGLVWAPGIILAILFLWLGMGDAAMRLGNYELSDALTPGRVENKENFVLTALQGGNALEVEARCIELLEINDKDAVAYDALALVEQAKGNYLEMVKYKKEAVWLQPYWRIEYDDYVEMLYQALTEYEANGDTDNYETCVSMLEEVPKRLEFVQNHTSPLAYKMNTKPYFILDERSQNIMKKYGVSTRFFE